MNCPICFDEMTDVYTIACGATVPHQICAKCEITMRLAATPTHLGRFIKCPLCRVVEPVHGERSRGSYEAELAKMYATLVPRPAPVPVPRPMPRPVTEPSTHLATVAGLTITMVGNRIVIACDGTVLRQYGLSPIDVVRVTHRIENGRFDGIVNRLVERMRNEFGQTEFGSLRSPAQVVPTARVARVAPAVPAARVWCQSGRREMGTCPTKGKTARSCSVASCLNHVCLKFKLCTSH